MRKFNLMRMYVYVHQLTGTLLLLLAALTTLPSRSPTVRRFSALCCDLGVCDPPPPPPVLRSAEVGDDEVECALLAEGSSVRLPRARTKQRIEFLNVWRLKH